MDENNNAGEGADINGSVHLSKGDFVGRDQFVRNITNNLYLNQVPPIDLEKHLDSYLSWCETWAGNLQLRGLSNHRQPIPLPLHTIYVSLIGDLYKTLNELNSVEPSRPPSTALERIHLNQIFTHGNHFAVVGGPGSGKTTFLLYLLWLFAHSIIADDQTLIKQELGLTGYRFPVYVPLSVYAAYRRNNSEGAVSTNLGHFISSYLAGRHVSTDLPTDFFVQLLAQNKSLLLLLDGLDEIVDEYERNAIRQEIEDLAIGRNNISIVITCRSRAYFNLSVLGHDFKQVQIRPLSSQTIQEIIRATASAVYVNQPQQAKGEAQKIYNQLVTFETGRQNQTSNQVSPLFTSPLMLRMLLMLYLNDMQLPHYRAELYSRTIDNLIVPDYQTDQNAVSETIRSLIGNQETHLSILQDIAEQLHARGQVLGREIRERDLMHFLKSEPKWEQYAESFIELTGLRTILLEKLQDNRSNYRFVHLSFQEFLVGRKMAEEFIRSGDVQLILDHITEHLHDSWWREPYLFMFGYLAQKNKADAELLFETIVAQYKQDAENNRPDRFWALLELILTALLESPEVMKLIGLSITSYLSKTFQYNSHLGLYKEGNSGYRIRACTALGRIKDPRPAINQVDESRFCFIPAGPFVMGAEKESHQIDLTYPYWLGQDLVTFAHYQSFMDEDGYTDGRWWTHANEIWQDGQVSSHGLELRNRPTIIEIPSRPVRGIHWFEAVAFCKWLTYRWQEAGLLTLDQIVMLPTEPQWEKGARGGLLLPTEPIVRSVKTIQYFEETGDEVLSNPDPSRP